MSDEGHSFIEESDHSLRFTRILVKELRRGAIYFTIAENNEMRRSGRYYTHAGLNWAQEDIGKYFFVSNDNNHMQMRKTDPDTMPVRKNADNDLPFIHNPKVFLVNKDKEHAQILIEGEVIEIKIPNCVQFMYILPHDFFSILIKEKIVKGEMKRTLTLINCDKNREEEVVKPLSTEDFFRTYLPTLQNVPEMLSEESKQQIFDKAIAVVANVPEGIKMLTDAMVRTRMLTPEFAKDFCYKVRVAKPHKG